MLLTILVIIGPITVWKRYRQRTRRSPLVNQLLRSPGETLLKELKEVNLDYALTLFYIPLLTVSFFANHISASYLGNAPETLIRYGFTAVLILGTLAYGITKIVRLARRRANLQIGYEGELAVAQELNQLMRSGALVFHDVPGDGFNIDHVVVSPNGAYAIETKARTKPNRNMGTEDAKVIFDGKTLTFPTWRETEPLDQAARQARWLSKWLSSAVGEAIEARGALALPGWYVECTGRADVAVFNPKNTRFLMSGWLKEPMQESVMQRIAHQLDQRCRDVEPTLYRNKNNKS